MNSIAFVQSDEHGRPYSVNGAAAATGFAMLGYDVRYFRPADLNGLPLAGDHVVVGGVGTVLAAIELLGAQRPSHISVPSVLLPFLGRACWRTTIGELRVAGRFPVFVKPYDESKLFNGRVVADAAALDRLRAPRDGFPPVADDTAILAQEPVAFASEWRTFIIRGHIVGVSHYRGDPLLFPAAGIVRTTIGAYAGAPAGYSADFGVTDAGRTLLIETNDGYSLGHGGLVCDVYAELLRARWREIELYGRLSSIQSIWLTSTK